MTSEEIREVALLLKKISDHYVFIENSRSEDRAAWRALNKRLEKIEKDRSERAKASARKRARKMEKKKLKAEKEAGIGAPVDPSALPKPPSKK